MGRWDILARRLGAERDGLLARYSALGIGGPAEVLVIARSRDELLAAVSAARELELPFRIFGGLTNCLLPDAGLCGVVILNRARRARIEADNRLYVEAGVSLASLARQAVQRGWDGLTWAVNLPGTVGGALVNNAGAFGGEIAAVLVSAEVLGPEGRVQEVGVDWFHFGYRTSRLQEGGADGIVLAAVFQLRPGDAEQLQAQAAEYTARRRRTQPAGRSLGSTFKNPPGDYAGRLIEAAGLKGARVGDIVVSTQHANFFINEGQGTAADYAALVRRVQEEVARQFGVRLELEIEVVEAVRSVARSETGHSYL